MRPLNVFLRLTYIFLIALAIFGCRDEVETSNNQQSIEDPLFELHSADQTGLHFSNNISESFQENILINSYLYNGGGVGILDINNDGLQDIYLTATQESNKLFLNKGNFKFEDITEEAGVGAKAGIKTGVTIVDINADGLQDIYVCRSGLIPSESRQNLLYINNGDLTFSEKAMEFGLADRSASNHANFFDFDLDGDLDVYILNHPVDYANVNKVNVRQDGADYQRVSTPPPNNIWDSDKFYKNNGDGSFSEIGKELGIFNRAWGLSVTVSDFNGDGYPDVFIGNDYIEPDILYINENGKSFSIKTDQFFRHTSNHTMGVDIADINNDGLVDVVALDMIAEEYSRQKELVTTMMLDRYNSLVRFGYGHQFMRNVLQLNTGRKMVDGYVFSDIGVIAGIWNTDWSWSPLVFDADNDGLKDLHITNGYRRDVSNLDYLNFTSPQLAPGGRFDASKTPTMNDYLKHIPSTPLSNYMFSNINGLQFNNKSKEWGMDQKSYSNGSAYADLDNDGDLDLIVNNVSDDVFIYQNNTVEKTEANWLQISLSGSELNPFGTGTKVTITFSDGSKQYQELSPTRGFLSSSQHIIHFGLGQKELVDRVEVTWPNGHISTLTNVSPNQKLTIKFNESSDKENAPNSETTLFQEYADSDIFYRHIEDEFEDFNRERLLPKRYSRLGPCMAVSDVNGDGLDDIFIGGAVGQSGALFVQNNNSRFKISIHQPWEQSLNSEDTGAHFFDADGDGDQDLYVACGGNSYELQSSNYQDRLYINNGVGEFELASNALPNSFVSTMAVESVDFDEDGDLDLFIGGRVSPGSFPSVPASSVLVNEDGIFTDYTGQIASSFQKTGMVTDLAWSDIDGDNKNELIVAGEWMPISVFKYSGERFENITSTINLQETYGWWNSIKAEDLDNDGDIDLVGGNLGLNTRYSERQNLPIKIYAKDFDRNGSIDPIMTFSAGGYDIPFAQKDLIIKQIPNLKKKFVYYADYSKSNIQTVFSELELNDAHISRIDMVTSGWFENVNGQFVWHEFPPSALVAPINDMIINDFDSDGIKDVLAIGNDYSLDIETGRIDAGNGVFLKGNSNKSFYAIGNSNTGFWAVKDARQIATLKLANGKNLVIVANNNAALDLFSY